MISNFSDNPQPAQQEINCDMMEVSYQEALVEHEIEKVQGCCDNKASESAMNQILQVTAH